MAEKKFSLFHLSLMPVSQLDFETAKMTRKDWLIHVFSNTFALEYRAEQTLVWLPKVSGEPHQTLVGVIQKQKPHSRHRPPEQGGEEIIEMEWQGAYALLDPNDHVAGQRIAIENDVVGLPTSLLGSGPIDLLEAAAAA